MTHVVTLSSDSWILTTFLPNKSEILQLSSPELKEKLAKIDPSSVIVDVAAKERFIFEFEKANLVTFTEAISEDIFSFFPHLSKPTVLRRLFDPKICLPPTFLDCVKLKLKVSTSFDLQGLLKSFSANPLRVNKEAFSLLSITKSEDHPALFTFGRAKPGACLVVLLSQNLRTTVGKSLFDHLVLNPSSNPLIIQETLKFFDVCCEMSPSLEAKCDKKLSKFVSFDSFLKKMFMDKCSVYDFAKMSSNIDISIDLLEEIVEIFSHSFCHRNSILCIPQIKNLKHCIEERIICSSEPTLRRDAHPDLSSLFDSNERLDSLLFSLESDEKAKLEEDNFKVGNLKIINVPELGYFISIEKIGVPSFKQEVQSDETNPDQPEDDKEELSSEATMEYPSTFKFLFRKGTIHFFKNTTTDLLESEVGDVRSKLTELQRLIFIEIEQFMESIAETLRLVDDLIASFDFFLGLKVCFKRFGFTRPLFVSFPGTFIIKNAINPLTQILLDTPFVPLNFVSFETSSLQLDPQIIGKDSLYSSYNGNRINLISGANFSGKSILLKTFAVSLYLAHLGFFVPAETMILSYLDSLSFFGPRDDSLLSSFSAEMDLLTSKSAIFLDEFGSNFSVDLGGALMQSIVTFLFSEFQTRKCPLFFFASHQLKCIAQLKKMDEKISFFYLRVLIKVGNVFLGEEDPVGELKQEVKKLLETPGSDLSQKVQLVPTFKLKLGVSPDYANSVLLLSPEINNQEMFLEVLFAGEEIVENNLEKFMDQYLQEFQKILG